MAREVRVSPDGNQVAIRSDWPEGGPMAYGIMDGVTAEGAGGGRWGSKADVEMWGKPDSYTFPDPPAPEQPPA